MADNLDRETDNQDQTSVTTADNTTTATASAPVPAAPSQAFSWKSMLGEDLSKAPTMQKFADTKDGLVEVAKSYVLAQELMGHKKAPLPNGPDDKDGLAAFNKAIGVPSSPELYNLPDAKFAGAEDGATFDKATFQQVMHKYGLTPSQAQGLWKEYANIINDSHTKMTQSYSDKLDQNINALRKMWGDAYAANVELGDMVINRFSDDENMANFLTATLAKDPAGIKFLAKIGTQFAENKVGDFQYKRFSMTPEEAKNEVSRIKADPNHPYSNEKATDKDHELAVEHVNRLIAISMGKRV